MKLDIPKSIKLYLENEKEIIKAKPSYNFLIYYAEKLEELIKEWEISNPKMTLELIIIKKHIYIFRKDIIGKLKNDYDKNNIRYKEKWVVEKNRIDNLKSDLLSIWNEKK